MNKSLLTLALNIIKSECINQENCDDCPLFDLRENNCGLKETPECWIIDEDEPCTEHILSA